MLLASYQRAWAETYALICTLTQLFRCTVVEPTLECAGMCLWTGHGLHTVIWSNKKCVWSTLVHTNPQSHRSWNVRLVSWCVSRLQAEEAYPLDQDNQGNTLVSVAPLNPPPETQEKPSVNGESPEADKTQPPPPTNGHSTAKAADAELWNVHVHAAQESHPPLTHPSTHLSKLSSSFWIHLCTKTQQSGLQGLRSSPLSLVLPPFASILAVCLNKLQEIKSDDDDCDGSEWWRRLSPWVVDARLETGDSSGWGKGVFNQHQLPQGPWSHTQNDLCSSSQ